MIERLQNWFWGMFVLRLAWLGFCPTCERYTMKGYTVYGECRPCYTKSMDEWRREPVPHIEY